MRRSTSRVGRLAVLILLLPSGSCGGDAGTTPTGDGDPDPPQPPTAPSQLAATPLSRTAIQLEWQDNSGDESGFRLERSPDGTSSWTSVATPVADVTSIEDAGLTEGTTWFYRVAALGAGGVSGFSNVAEATTPSGTEGAVLEVENGITGTLPPPGTPLTERNLLQEVRDVAATAAGIAGVDTVIALENALATQIVYDDGIVHLFINNRPADAADLGSSASATAATPAVPARFATARALPTGPPAATDGPPGSPRAVVAVVDGGDPLANEVAGMLSEAGYDVLPLGATLAHMRQYANLGALYLDTHGVSFVRFFQAGDGSTSSRSSFALQTATLLGTDLTPWRSELLDGSLTINSVRDAGGTLRTQIGITETFIDRHWSFDDGVVVIHACFVGSGPFLANAAQNLTLDPTPVRASVLGTGARAMMGFDNLTWHTYARPSVLHFLDRMLGADSYDRQDPPLRPFDLDEVATDMTDRGLMRFTRPSMTFLGLGLGGNDVRVVFSRRGGRTTLAPSLRTMDVVDDVEQGSGQLTLQGLFGVNAGTVEVGGAAVPVESWSERTIVARPPFQGGGSVGPVVVRKPTGVESNATPLTEWRGTVTLETTVQGLVATATMDVRFRADVHRFRPRLQDEPEHREVSTYFSPASTGSIQGSGTRTDGQVTTEWYGQNSMAILPTRFVDQGAFPLTGNVMGGDVRLDPDGGEAEICIAAWGYVNSRSTGPDGTILTNPAATFITPEIVDRMRGFLGCVNANLDGDSFVIGSGRKTHSVTNGSFSLEWSDFAPAAAPDDRTAG
ncbi:MAG: fibronectin type III domain-containing protein [Gemmatimonadetes bacterium]|nr:fibronectin type III domain-containing protein [Gemmatimonadota bacterium]